MPLLFQQVQRPRPAKQLDVTNSINVQFAVSRALVALMSIGLFVDGRTWRQEEDRGEQNQALIDQMDAFIGYLAGVVYFSDTELLYALILLSRIQLREESFISAFTIRRFLLACLHIAIQMTRDYEPAFWRWPELLPNLDLTTYIAMYAEALKILKWDTHVSSAEIREAYVYLTSFMPQGKQLLQAAKPPVSNLISTPSTQPYSMACISAPHYGIYQSSVR